MFGGLDDLEHDCTSFKSKSDYVKRERGEWIKIQFDDKTIGYRCTKCYTTWDSDTNFCPNCGVDMRKEDNNANNIR
jgi:uncharacterized OB-fold protein